MNKKQVIKPILITTPKPTKNGNSFKLYVALRDRGFGNPYYNTFLGFMAYAPLTLSLIVLVTFLTGDTKNNPTVILILVLCSIVSAFFLFRKFLAYLLNYSNFKNWQERLSFEIKGSEALLSKPEIRNWLYWYEYCSININYSPDCSPQTKERIALSTATFIKNAEDVVRQFNIYDHWELKDHKLTGFANSVVIGFIQRFISKDLNNINKQYGGIDSIEIQTSKKMIPVTHGASEYD
ncbi:MAG: hypothetical protein V4506_11105 [Bacteroidota bacterium]